MPKAWAKRAQAICLKGGFRVWEMAMEEAALPRTRRDAALAELEREDLDLFAVDELQGRIARLEAEIARARRAIEKKQGVRSAAESLFTFGKA